MTNKKLNKYRLIIYNNDLYQYDTNTYTWNYLHANRQKAEISKLTLRRMMMIEDGKDDLVSSNHYNRVMAEVGLDYDVSMSEIDTSKIVFTNGQINLRSGEWEPFNTNKIVPFTPFQIQYPLITNPVELELVEKHKRELVDKFFKEISNHELAFETSLLELIGSAMSPRNDSIFPIFKSAHKTSGKGTMIEIMKRVTGLARQIQGDQWWKKGNQFALGVLKGQLVGYVDEVPQQMPSESSEKIKAFADSKSHLEIERKGVDQEQMLNTTLFLATTNHDVNFYSVDDSIKGRVIWYEFKMNSHGDEYKFTPEEIDTIVNDEYSIQYIIYRAIQCYVQVIKRKGNRNDRFTKPQSHYDFWEIVGETSKALEIIESDSTLSSLFDNKETFIAGEDIKAALRSFKMVNPEETITLKGFYNDFISYIQSNRLGKAIHKKAPTPNKHGKRPMGLAITWYGGGNG